MNIINTVVTGIKAAGNIFDELFTSKEEAINAKAKLQEVFNPILTKILELEQKLISMKGQIITAEATSGSWLTRNWRPLLMVWFAFLMGLRWFGFSAPGITEAEYMELWNIIKIGIGGYITTRGVEKIVKEFKNK